MMIPSAPRRSLGHSLAARHRAIFPPLGWRRPVAGRALTVALVVLLTGVSLIGLWVTYALRAAYEREAQSRAQAEARLAARALADAIMAQGELPSAMSPERLPATLPAAAGLYDRAGQRRAMISRQDPAGELSLPERLDLSGLDQATDLFANDRCVITAPLRDAGGERLGALYLVTHHRGARLSTVVTRLVYELPLWLAVATAGLWLVHALLGPGRASAPPRGARAAPVDFVMAGYQEVIDRLQSAGRELERLRSDAETRAVAQAQFSDRLIAGIPDALIVVASDGSVGLANLAAQDLFGQSPGVAYRVFFADAPALADLVAASLADGVPRRKADMEAVLAGHRRTLDASVSPIPGAASVLCLVANITELAALRATTRAKETLEGVGELAAGIAHEFKNSLATIDGYARLLAQDAPQSDAALALREEARRLTQVVTDFLTFARPTRIAFAPVSLAEIAAEAAIALRDLAAQRGVTLRIAQDLPTVAGDAALLRRALENLLRNAIEAIPESAPTKLVSLRAETDAGEATLMVEDSGGGLPPEVAANLFAPFFTTKKEGHGLGLAIVRKIVVSHNGRIEACNLPEGGARFRVSLPLQTPSETRGL
ncbi:MAG: hypothetical protein CFK52_09975 [Chloracidobacterium sp. CP2_5A]|nr:MAG: hypothetical protein CFK52_09975 [Chloracidobacterium sp. CP2_5A]